MLHDFIRGDIPMETGASQGMEYSYPVSSPHMYDSNQAFTQVHVQGTNALLHSFFNMWNLEKSRSR